MLLSKVNYLYLCLTFSSFTSTLLQTELRDENHFSQSFKFNSLLNNLPWVFPQVQIYKYQTEVCSFSTTHLYLTYSLPCLWHCQPTTHLKPEWSPHRFYPSYPQLLSQGYDLNTDHTYPLLSIPAIAVLLLSPLVVLHANACNSL